MVSETLSLKTITHKNNLLTHQCGFITIFEPLSHRKTLIYHRNFQHELSLIMKEFQVILLIALFKGETIVGWYWIGINWYQC